MNGAMAPSLGDVAGIGQVLGASADSFAGHESPLITGALQIETVQTLLAQLDQVVGDAVEGAMDPETPHEEVVSAMPDVPQSGEGVVWMPSLPAMQAWIPPSVSVRRPLELSPASAVPNELHVSNDSTTPISPTTSMKTVRSDVTLLRAAPMLAVDDSETLAPQGLNILASMPSQAASVHMTGIEVSGVESTPQRAVSVQQGPEALVQALAQRLQVQQMQGNQVAIVRLDPPQMGTIEVRISHDMAGVQVHMQASNSEVGRQLAAVVDPLRQELLARSTDAHITVSSSRSTGAGGQSDAQRQSSPQDEEPEIGQALHSADRASFA